MKWAKMHIVKEKRIETHHEVGYQYYCTSERYEVQTNIVACYREDSPTHFNPVLEPSEVLIDELQPRLLSLGSNTKS